MLKRLALMTLFFLPLASMVLGIAFGYFAGNVLGYREVVMKVLWGLGTIWAVLIILFVLSLLSRRRIR